MNSYIAIAVILAISVLLSVQNTLAYEQLEQEQRPVCHLQCQLANHRDMQLATD